MLFFEINAGLATRYYSGSFEPFPEDLGEFVLGDSPIEDTAVEVKAGTQPGDMVFAAFNVVSQAFVNALEEQQATGFEAVPIDLVLTKDNHRIVDGYYLLRMRGRGGPIDEERSSLIRDGRAISNYDGLYIYESEWDGSDVFVVGDGIGIFVVERIAQALKKAKLKNVKITPNHECRIM